MLGRSFRMMAVGVAASAAALMLGAGVAHAKPVPINPCVFCPQGCQGPLPPVKIDPCVIDPNACVAPTTVPQPSKPKPSSGSGSSSGTGSNGTAGDSSLAGTTAVHAVRHTSDSSGTDPLVIGAGATLAASLAGLGGFALWRRRSLA